MKHFVFLNKKLRNVIKNMVIIERISIILVLCISFQTNLKKNVQTLIESVLYYTHQNLILFIEILIERLYNKSEIKVDFLKEFKKFF